MSLELFLALHGALIVRIDENANVPVQNSSKYVFDLLTQMELNYGRHVFTAVLDWGQWDLALSSLLFDLVATKWFM